jgi:hypothetical protein
MSGARRGADAGEARERRSAKVVRGAASVALQEAALCNNILFQTSIVSCEGQSRFPEELSACMYVTNGTRRRATKQAARCYHTVRVAAASLRDVVVLDLTVIGNRRQTADVAPDERQALDHVL